jgi:predicted ribosome quality control (RQC) complex YloA/Tae2 family protein
MLSLSELEHVVRVLNQDFAGARVERWLQPDGARLVVTLYRRDPVSGEGRKRHLVFSVAETLARISELASTPRAAEQMPAFTGYLRAHLSRARLVRASLRGRDRQLALCFEAREGEFELLLALLGRRSNVYLLDAAGVIRAMLRTPKQTRPELEVGVSFQNPGGELADAGEDRWPEVAAAEYLAAIEAHYRDEEGERGCADLARRLLKALRKEKKNAQRRLARVESELAEADGASELQRHGELLKGALDKIEAGASEVRLRDYETGEDVLVSLDPTKSAKANMEATFKRYHKLLRRLTKAGGQLDDARARHAEICALEEQCSQLAERKDAEGVVSELESLAALPQIAKLLERSRPTGRQDGPSRHSNLPERLRNVPRRLLPRRYRSREALEIWVGRSDEGNDYLSTRLARGKDLFFHLDGAPGSHVILRTEGRPDPPQESVLDASELAVHFSKQKNASRADVHVVPIKNVKKPKGVKKGLVYVTGGKTVHLRRESARLQRVLKSRIDD